MFYSCPKCNSDDITAYPFEGEDTEVWREVFCKPCGFTWTEVFVYSHPLSNEKPLEESNENE